MNKIGVRGHDFGKMNIDELPKNIKAKGFDTIQLAPTKAIEGIKNFEDITENILFDCREAFSKNDVAIDVYGCYVEIGLFDKTERLEAVTKFKKAIKHCEILGAKVVGTETTHFPLNGENRHKAYELVKDSLLRMVDEAEKLGVDIAIEPVALHTIDTPELTKKLLEEIKSDRLKVIIDAVNLFTVENIHNQRKIISDCFELFGDKISTLHLKDISLIGNQDKDKIVVVNDTFKWECIGEGIVDYSHIFSFIKDKEVSLLREGATLDSYEIDIKNIKSIL